LRLCGLPKERTTLIAGGPGSGKTLLGVEFLVHGALDYGEPGVLLAFEESADDLSANVASLGYDLNRMRAERLLVIDSFRLDGQSPTESVADYLAGLFIRLDCAVDSIGRSG
jgi:circadian clock protein KaiC